jgi:Cu/Ag efflux pump CusA
LAGVSAEFRIVMLICLDHAIEKRRSANKFTTEHDLIEAIEDGAVIRVRPKAMTVQSEIIELRVRWYPTYWLSYRDLGYTPASAAP